MKKAILIFLISLSNINSEECPCSYNENLIGIKIPNLKNITELEYFKFKEEIEECYKYRKRLGIHINYCKDTEYAKMKNITDISKYEKEYLLKIDTMCYDFMDDYTRVEIDSCKDCYMKALSYPNAHYDRTWSPKNFIFPAIGFMVVGTALTVLSVNYTNWAFNDYENMNDWYGDIAEGAVKLSAVGVIFISGVLDIGGSAIFTLGFVRININKQKIIQKEIIDRIQ